MRNLPHILLAVLALAGLTLAAVSYWPWQAPPPQLALVNQDGFVPAADGTLIRGEGDERVYYVEGGRKRWIESAEAFRAQGFDSQNVRQVPADQLARYPDGEPVTAISRLILPGELTVLPDLAPLAPYDVHLATLNGRTVLRFTGSFWNKGHQAFYLQTEQNLESKGQESTEDVYQSVTAADGSQRTRFVGTFVFHLAHNHHHYADFADYILEPVRLAGGVPPIAPRRLQKTSFCFRDSERLPADIPTVPARGVFNDCGRERQGLSAGWIDVYASTLPEQYLDVQDLPPGIYALSFLIDPRRRFIESRVDNNIGTTFVDLDVANRRARVVAALAPFPTVRNQYADGTLVRTGENGNVYLLQAGRKRWLRSVDIFNSYGHSWANIYPVTESMAQAIPSQQLIRRVGTSEVWVLNENGYRRHVRTPELFAEYGFRADGIADVNDLDFASYPEGTLIMRTGDDQVYLISGTARIPLGTLTSLQGTSYDLRGLFVVSESDLNSYQSIRE